MRKVVVFVSAWAPPLVAAVVTLVMLAWHGADGPWMNDVVLQDAILRAMEGAWSRGESPFDPWFTASPMGAAILRTYQHLPHWVLFAARRMVGATGEPTTWWWASAVFFTALLPLGMTWGARLSGLRPRAAAWCGGLAPLVTEAGGYGLSWDSQLWDGPGLVTQAWGAVAILPAAGAAVHLARTGRGYARTAFLAAWAAGCHPVAGLSAAVLAACLLVAGDAPLVAAARRMALLALLLVDVTAHQWLPMLEDAAWLHRSVHEPAWKFDGVSRAWLVQHLPHGHLVDGARGPWLWSLVLCGLAWLLLHPAAGAVRSRRAVRVGVPLALLCGVTLMAGVDVLGPWLRSVPGLSAFHLHRLVVLVQSVFLLCAGVGVAWLVSGRGARAAAGLGVVCAVVTITGMERVDRVQQSARRRASNAQWAAADADLARLVEELRLPGHGMVHVGMRATWAESTRVTPDIHLHAVTTAQNVASLGMLYHSMTPAGDVVFDMDPRVRSQVDLLGVTTHVLPVGVEGPPGAEKHRSLGRWQTWRVPGVSPLGVVQPLGFVPRRDLVDVSRAWFRQPVSASGGVLRVSAASTPAPDLSTLAAPVLGVSRVTSWERPSPAHATGTVELEVDAWVVLKTGFHPRWSASVDGAPVPVEAVTPGFPAVAVPRGMHRVEFSYAGDSRTAWLALAAAAQLLLLHALGRRFRRE